MGGDETRKKTAETPLSKVKTGNKMLATVPATTPNIIARIITTASFTTLTQLPYFTTDALVYLLKCVVKKPSTRATASLWFRNGSEGGVSYRCGRETLISIG